MSDLAQTHYFSGVAEYQQALDSVIAHAQRFIQVFDYDLREGGWNSLQRFEALKNFILNDREARLHIVLHNVEYVRRQGVRLLNLQRQYSHAVFIHETLPEARSINDPMILVDKQHYVHRFHYEQPRGELVLNNPDPTQRLLRRFDEIWHASAEAVTATTLGL